MFAGWQRREPAVSMCSRMITAIGHLRGRDHRHDADLATGAGCPISRRATSRAATASQIVRETIAPGWRGRF